METAKKKADEMMASRAAADQYRAGAAKQAEAEKFLSEKKYHEAWDSSGASIAAYNQSYEIAKEKRARAQSSLQAADQAQTETNTRLQEVTREIGSSGTGEVRQ